MSCNYKLKSIKYRFISTKNNNTNNSRDLDKSLDATSKFGVLLGLNVLNKKLKGKVLKNIHTLSFISFFNIPSTKVLVVSNNFSLVYYC